MNNIIDDNNGDMRVLKRNGELEYIAFDKIMNRVKKLGQEANIQINYSSLIMKVIDQLYDKIPTSKIDELTAEQCAALSTTHPDYGLLADRIIVSNHHKNTNESFTEVMYQLYKYTDKSGQHSPIISNNTWTIINANQRELDLIIHHDRDYLIDYLGFKTLERAYLARINNVCIERPSHMWLRVAVGIHGADMVAVKETYDLMSLKYFTHATPTLFNAGTPRKQLSSCYLLGMESDSVDGIYNTLKDCANISKWAGGIGLHIHNVRASGTQIRGTNGTSNGIVPMLKVFNNTARYISQGSGRRNGSFAIYIEPWHGDIEAFLEMKKNQGDEEMKARDLFYALWTPDLFMERVKENGKWTLFCPHICPGLSSAYGQKFNTLYCKYESEDKGIKTMNARDLWYKILDAQMETGTPYILYKDSANKKSNQKNLGTIMSSNLCSEIIQYSDATETAVCNLASISLPAFVNLETKEFDYEELHKVVKVVATNLNKIIDINFYPTEKTKRSNLLHRPVGIGVQGLADAFILMDVAFHSEEAKQINKLIFETIYHGALERSNELAIQRYPVMSKLHNYLADEQTYSLSPTVAYNKMTNHEPVKFPRSCSPDDVVLYKQYNPIIAEFRNLSTRHAGAYSSFSDSPAAQGFLQFDLWNKEQGDERYNWTALKLSIQKYGLRNSLSVAPMPTASTSQILGNNECFEPLTSNIYSRRTMAGEFIVANKYLMRELISLGLWNDKIKNNIVANNGSIQQIMTIPEHIRNKYKIVWEMPMKHLIDMACDRGVYICQSQSLNLWMEDPNYNTLTSMHFYSWKQGLKTGIYYLRRKAKHQAQQFTIEPESSISSINADDTICEMCSA